MLIRKLFDEKYDQSTNGLDSLEFLSPLTFKFAGVNLLVIWIFFFFFGMSGSVKQNGS